MIPIPSTLLNYIPLLFLLAQQLNYSSRLCHYQVQYYQLLYRKDPIFVLGNILKTGWQNYLLQFHSDVNMKEIFLSNQSKLLNICGSMKFDKKYPLEALSTLDQSINYHMAHRPMINSSGEAQTSKSNSKESFVSKFIRCRFLRPFFSLHFYNNIPMFVFRLQNYPFISLRFLNNVLL